MISFNLTHERVFFLMQFSKFSIQHNDKIGNIISECSFCTGRFIASFLTWLTPWPLVLNSDMIHHTSFNYASPPPSHFHVSMYQTCCASSTDHSRVRHCTATSRDPDNHCSTPPRVPQIMITPSTRSAHSHMKSTTHIYVSKSTINSFFSPDFCYLSPLFAPLFDWMGPDVGDWIDRPICFCIVGGVRVLSNIHPAPLSSILVSFYLTSPRHLASSYFKTAWRTISAVNSQTN